MFNKTGYRGLQHGSIQRESRSLPESPVLNSGLLPIIDALFLEKCLTLSLSIVIYKTGIL